MGTPQEFHEHTIMLLPKLLLASLVAGPSATGSIPGKLHIISVQDGVLGCNISDKAPVSWTTPMGQRGNVQFLVQPTADIQVTFEGFTREAKDAFQRAVDIWAKVLSTEVPVKIEAKWVSFEDENTLGAAGAASWSLYSFQGTNFWVPASLRDQFRGSALRPTEPHIRMEFSKDHDWYYGVDGWPDETKHDFISVVLHEIGHGLGFISSFSVDESGNLEVGWEATDGNTYATLYDTKILDSDFNPVIASSDLTSDHVLSALTNHRLFWSGRVSYRVNGGPVMLWAPSEYSSGSSVSHMDEHAYPVNSPDTLMTPWTSMSQATHTIGPVTRGLLSDLGWTIRDNTVYLPGFISGDDEKLGSSVLLASQQKNGATVIVEALDADGNDLSGDAVSFLGLSGTTASTATVAQFENRELEINSPEFQWGSVRISSDRPVSASLIWTWEGIPIDVEPSSLEFREALVPVEIGSEKSTVIDLHNTEVRSQTVELRLRNQSGSLASSKVLKYSIPANGLVSLSVEDDTFSDLTDDEFEGSVHVTATRGKVAGVALGLNEEGSHRIQISPILD